MASESRHSPPYFSISHRPTPRQTEALLRHETVDIPHSPISLYRVEMQNCPAGHSGDRALGPASCCMNRPKRDVTHAQDKKALFLLRHLHDNTSTKGHIVRQLLTKEMDTSAV